eukprot:SM000008S22198  [mRNA]  locus=s8:358675:358907:- [translate_table: standard]
MPDWQLVNNEDLHIFCTVITTVCLAFTVFFAHLVKLELRFKVGRTLFVALTATQVVVDGQSCEALLTA